MAVFWSLLMLWLYKEGSKFKLRTNHQALIWILDLVEVTRRLASWCFRLLKFDFELGHRPGVYNQPADAISRLSKKNPIAEGQVEDDIPTLDVERNDKNNLSVVCAETHVKVSMPSKAELLALHNCDTCCNNVK